MQPNPGLSARVNLYLSALDAILPKRSRKDDVGSELLHRAITDIGELAPQAGSQLGSFIATCERFRNQQYRVNADREHQDTGLCWLPLVFVGKNWQALSRHLLRIDLPEAFGRARSISLKPALPSSIGRLKLSLAPRVTGVTEAGYEQFASLVRERFPRLESVFDPIRGNLEFIAGRLLEIDYPDHVCADHPCSGALHPWIELLLDLRAVELLELTYPIRPKEVPFVADIVCAALILPQCPVDWRQPSTLGTSGAIQQIENRLGIGALSPFHLVLSAVEPEWYALVDAVIARSIDPQLSSTSALPDSEADYSAFVRMHLARTLTFPPGLELQPNTEYSRLSTVFRRADDQDGTLVPHAELVCEMDAVSTSLTQRLGDTAYAFASAKRFSVEARSIARTLSQIRGNQPGITQPSHPSLKKVPPEFVTRVNGSFLDMSAFVLNTIANNLEILFSMEREEDIRRERLVARDRKLSSPEGVADSSHEMRSLHQLIKVAILDERVDIRCRALAALAYYLRSNDVVSDEEPSGLTDDWFITSRVLSSNELRGQVSPALLAWAIRIQGNADHYMSRDIQRDVIAEFESINLQIQQIVAQAND